MAFVVFAEFDDMQYRGVPHREATPEARPVGRIRLIALLPIIVAAVVAAVTFCMRPADIRFPSVVTPRDSQRAREAFELKYGRPPDRLDILSWLAGWYLTQKRPNDAVTCFAEIPTNHPVYGHMARLQQGRTLFRLHKVTEAERQLKELIVAEEASPQIEPEFLINARQQLRHILEVELRFEERHQLLKGVIDRGEDIAFEAVAGCFPTMLRWNGPDAIQWHAQFMAADPDNVWVRISHGRYLTGQGRADEACPILEAVVAEQPTNLRAISALVAALREAGDVDRADQLILALPPRSRDDPWTLLVQRGYVAVQNGNLEEARNAFEQLQQSDATSTEGWQGIALVARLQNDIPRQTQANQMVTSLGRIQNYLGKTTQDAGNPSSFLDVADLCAEFQLNREGAVMARFAQRLAPDDGRVQATVKAFRERLMASQLPALLGP